MTIPEGLDRIELRGISAHGHHGLFDFERTIHYGELAEAVLAAVESNPVDLIETLALRIADMCLSEASVQWVSVTVHKPEAPIAVTFTDVAVTIERSRL